MTPTEINIAIAEEWGWVRLGPLKQDFGREQFQGPKGNQCVSVGNIDNGIRNVNGLPNYHRDLNAMHEAEKSIQCGRFLDYSENLLAIIRRANPTSNSDEWRYDLLHSTAPQRAEAFLRTLGKWIE